MNPKKIVYIVGGLYGKNGMSQVLSQKINYLAAHTPYEVYMILTENPRAPWVYEIDSRVKYVNFDINFDELDTLPLWKKIYCYQKKQRLYKKVLTDYLCDLKPDITVSAMRREINFLNDIPDGSKKVGEIHFNKSNYREFHKKFLPRFVNQAITNRWRGKLVKEINRLDRFVVLSREDMEEWTEVPHKQVIYNPLRFFPSETSTCESKRVIAAGRYTEQKGFDLLIDAWKEVAGRHPDWKLDIYGNGEHAVYQAMADRAGLSACVTCHPAVRDIYEKYLESAIFAFSSRYEGFGLVLAEAMSCGIPGVSFACPCGPKDIISNGEDGILVAKEDVKSFADSLCLLIENKEIRVKMGKKAKENMKRFNETAIMKQWVELFCQLSS